MFTLIAERERERERETEKCRFPDLRRPLAARRTLTFSHQEKVNVEGCTVDRGTGLLGYTEYVSTCSVFACMCTNDYGYERVTNGPPHIKICKRDQTKRRRRILHLIQYCPCAPSGTK